MHVQGGDNKTLRNLFLHAQYYLLAWRRLLLPILKLRVSKQSKKMASSSKKTRLDYQIKRGNHIYKKTALGTQRTESKIEDQCPFFTAVNDEIRRLGNEYLSDVKAHLEYYPNVQRASMHLMKVAGLSAGSRISFDLENLPLLIMIFSTAYGKLGMNKKSFEEAVHAAQNMLIEMNEINEDLE